MTDETHNGMTPDEQEIWRAGFEAGADVWSDLHADLKAVVVAAQTVILHPFDKGMSPWRGLEEALARPGVRAVLPP